MQSVNNNMNAFVYYGKYPVESNALELVQYVYMLYIYIGKIGSKESFEYLLRDI